MSTPARACVRPGDPGWPSDAEWERLDEEVGGRLIRIAPGSAAFVSAAPASFKNPYRIGDDLRLTQTSGWLDAWTPVPSAYAIAARTAADVAAAIRFARANGVRLAVRGGAHSYQGTSNAADSLLIWTRRMDDIVVHEQFAARGCENEPAGPAVSVGAGAMWGRVYDAVTTQHGRYVQGGGCLTVGVGGLVLSGGFGSFSKAYGLAAAGLIEADIVTADGVVRTVNRRSHPDLFWAIKGGGGGTFGVVTRLTLRTRELPIAFGIVTAKLKAASNAAFLDLIGHAIDFYRERLFNPHWGEQFVFGADNTLTIDMVFQGLTQTEAEDLWRPFLAECTSAGRGVSIECGPVIDSFSARQFWNPAFRRARHPEVVLADDRPERSDADMFWTGDHEQVGQVIHAYRSAWLPATLLGHGRVAALVASLFASTRHWTIALHFNKGLAGAPEDEVRAARDTAINPLAIDAFALAMCIAAGPPAFPGMSAAPPDIATGRRHAASVARAMDELLTLVPVVGSYVSESDFFERNWQSSFWGSNYSRLADVKRTYDPAGVFLVHHGVGSAADGFVLT